MMNLFFKLKSNFRKKIHISWILVSFLFHLFYLWNYLQIPFFLFITSCAFFHCSPIITIYVVNYVNLADEFYNTLSSMKNE